MRKLFCAGLVMAMVFIAFAVTRAEATEMLVCILDKRIENNPLLPGGNLALPGSKVRCSMGVGDEADTFETTLQVLGKNNWKLVTVVKERVEAEYYGVYYLQRPTPATP